MATSDDTIRLDWMRRRPLENESGQALAEYALILAGIAMAVIVAVAALGGSVGDLFDSNGRQLSGASRPGSPPATPLAFPTRLEECVDPGWHSYPQFDSEEECVEYIERL
jgi:Flp pilus assembly pilin Flp